MGIWASALVDIDFFVVAFAFAGAHWRSIAKDITSGFATIEVLLFIFGGSTTISA